jgi:hypothetical protein
LPKRTQSPLLPTDSAEDPKNKSANKAMQRTRDKIGRHGESKVASR